MIPDKYLDLKNFNGCYIDCLDNRGKNKLIIEAMTMKYFNINLKEGLNIASYLK